MNQAAGASLDTDQERRVAWLLVGCVLVVLTVVKPLGPLPYLGPIALTLAAVMQLYLPLWRIDKLGLGHRDIGLHLETWRRDLRGVVALALITFPPYIVGYHLFMTELHGWAATLGLDALTPWLPQLRFNPHLPAGAMAWGAALWWFAQLLATHGLGVALPEETFYRGYLQPRLQTRWPPRWRVLGTPIGKAALVATFLFALGHFLGEWNPLRMGPFFPGLIFAWQRNRTGSVVGAITYHTACNLLGEILSTQYA